MSNPCDSTTSWTKAPKPSHNPLAVMKWATGQEQDKFGCTRKDAQGKKKFHAGLDLQAPIGTKCFAVEDAKVEDVGSGADLGKWVSISFTKNGKTFGVAYTHLSKQSVKNGDNVKAGAELGETGDSGNAAGETPHLHLEVQDQVWVAYASAADRSKHGLDPNDWV